MSNIVKGTFFFYFLFNDNIDSYDNLEFYNYRRKFNEIRYSHPTRE
jgi:hypothetical protein